MDDTQDLSTRRGASLTLLNAGAEIEELLHGKYPNAVRKVFIGASEALFVLKDGVDAAKAAESVRKLLASTTAPAPGTPHYPTPVPVGAMTFVVDIQEGSDAEALKLVEARLKRRQFQSPTLPPDALRTAPDRRAVAEARPACPIEHRLPATAEHPVRKDMFKNAVEVWRDPDADVKGILVAETVDARRKYGRKARQLFYGHLLGPGVRPPNFADGFVDLVKRPPDAVPLPLQGKIAVIAADGIGFGKLIEKAVERQGGDRIAGLRSFSSDVEAMLRDHLLRPLIEAFEKAHEADEETDTDPRIVSIPSDHADNPEARSKRWSPILRFETLTYAGEDIVWLCPAWLAWDVLGFLFKAAEGAKVAGAAPRFRVGVAICSYKMPIRKARELAEELAYKVDDGSGEAGCQIELVESIDVSDRYLDAHRARLAGGGPSQRFTIKAAALDGVAEHIRKLRQPRSLPPSQLHRLLRRAAAGQAFTDAAGHAAVLKDLSGTLDHGYGYGKDSLTADHLASAALGAEGDPLFGLLRAAQLWDVVEPLGRPIITPGKPRA